MKGLDQYLIYNPNEDNQATCAYNDTLIESNEEVLLLSNGDLVKKENMDNYIRKYIIDAIVTLDEHGEIKSYKKVDDSEE